LKTPNYPVIADEPSNLKYLAVKFVPASCKFVVAFIAVSVYVDNHVITPCNDGLPLTFNDDKQVELFCKVVFPVTYKEPNAV
jgi:hypothetical protein